MLTFAEMDGHALRLEQAVVLRLGVALGQCWSWSRQGLSQWMRQGGRHRRRGGGGGGRGRRVYLGVERRDSA